jgi:hypothetical protein
LQITKHAERPTWANENVRPKYSPSWFTAVLHKLLDRIDAWSHFTVFVLVMTVAGFAALKFAKTDVESISIVVLTVLAILIDLLGRCKEVP